MRRLNLLEIKNLKREEKTIEIPTDNKSSIQYDNCTIKIFDVNNNLEYTLTLPFNIKLKRDIVERQSEYGITIKKGNNIEELKLSDDKKYIFSYNDGQFKLKSGMSCISLNTINKIMTSDVSNSGFNYENNRKLLKNYLRILDNGVYHKDRVNSRDDILTTVFNEVIRRFFSKEIIIEDLREEIDKKKFSGIYVVNSRSDNDKINIIISSNNIRHGNNIGMCILNEYFLISTLNVYHIQHNIHYHYKYNNLIKNMKKENIKNISYILDILRYHCLAKIYKDDEKFIEEVINNE